MQRDGNIYTSVDSWQVPSSPYFWTPNGNEVSSGHGTEYADAASGDFTPKTGSNILNHNGSNIAAIITELQAVPGFSGFDFTKDMDGNTIVQSAPKCGPRVDPATWS